RLPYRIVGSESRDLVAEGAFVFVCVGPGGPKRFDPRLVPRDVPESARAAAGPPPVPAPIGRPSWRSRAAAAVLPRSLARGRRLPYRPVGGPRGRGTTPAEFVSGLRSVWRSDEGRRAATPVTFGDRLLDVCLPPAAADAFRAARRAKQEEDKARAKAGPIRWVSRPPSLAKGQRIDLRV